MTVCRYMYLRSYRLA